jgi:hypothetical protein
MREFSDVFPKEFSRLPLKREVEVSIDVSSSISLITQAPYWMALAELAELKLQLQKLI